MEIKLKNDSISTFPSEQLMTKLDASCPEAQDGIHYCIISIREGSELRVCLQGSVNKNIFYPYLLRVCL